MNAMKEIKLEKVTLNIGVGGDANKLDKSMKLLQAITNSKPVKTVTYKRIPTWGVRPGLPIGCMVTIRGKKAEEMLIRLFASVANKLNYKKFDNHGNLSFGIKEYIDIPGVKYDADLGIIGLEAAITLKRAGFRIKNRKIRKKKIPTKHKIPKEESMNFVKEKFGVSLIE